MECSDCGTIHFQALQTFRLPTKTICRRGEWEPGNDHSQKQYLLCSSLEAPRPNMEVHEIKVAAYCFGLVRRMTHRFQASRTGLSPSNTHVPTCWEVENDLCRSRPWWLWYWSSRSWVRVFPQGHLRWAALLHRVCCRRLPALVAHADYCPRRRLRCRRSGIWKPPSRHHPTTPTHSEIGRR